MIKDRSKRQLRRGGKNVQNYTKCLNDPDHYDGLVTHLEPDILECEVGLRKHDCK